MKTTNKTEIKFKKTLCVDRWSNVYTAKTEKNDYELYRERTYKNNGTSKCDGDWIVQKNGDVDKIFSTLKEAKNYVTFIELF